MKKEKKLAVALRYEDQDSIPVVLATGKGEIAEKILERARIEKIPEYKDEALAKILTTLEVGTKIPPELYAAVAKVVSFVWELDNKYSKVNQNENLKR